ncbi:CvpA family protein [Arthrospiribacter ruber]|uniref:CvpA family protein n=1 Tax=Arthrospiribacter ruber TaxID=2487934 RepID=A0A951MCU1_9BACT|nr:CvpA family protein [Arthrospiribacter ruber]MBW3467877.1 CvpA family protein [Arthrospiribacter ruber]
MGALDIVILVFCILGAYSGYRQGLFISILSIVAFILAVIVAFHFMDWGAQLLASRVDEMTFLLPFIAFILIFLGVIMIIRGLAFLVKKTLDFTILGSVDSIAGALLGIVKTAFILSLFIWIADSFEFSLTEDWKNDSKSYAWIQPIAPAVITAMDQYTPIIRETVASIQQIVKSTPDGFID